MDTLPKRSKMGIVRPHLDALDIGCGLRKRPDAIGLDCIDFDTVDVVHQIESEIELPFTDNRFSKVYLTDILEHVQDIPWLLSEVHRVSKPGAEVSIQYPHFSGRNAYGDVTHCHYLSISAFDHFIPQTEFGQKYQYFMMYGREFPFRMIERKLDFKHDGISRPLCKLLGERRYESLISRTLPINAVNLELQVLK